MEPPCQNCGVENLRHSENQSPNKFYCHWFTMELPGQNCGMENSHSFWKPSLNKKKEGGVTRMWPPNYQLILHPWHEKVCGVIKLTWPEPGLPRGPSIKILFLSIIWCRTCIVPKYICMHSHSPIMDIGQFIQRSISNQTSYLKCAEYVNIKSLLNTSRISQIGKEMSVHAPQ